MGDGIRAKKSVWGRLPGDIVGFVENVGGGWVR